MTTEHQRILVLDLGSPHARLVARLVRQLGVYSEVMPADARPELIEAFAPDGLILAGGTGPEIKLPEVLGRLDVPVLNVADQAMDTGSEWALLQPGLLEEKAGLGQLQDFVETTCGCTPSWTMKSIIDEQIAQVRASVGEDAVLLGLSGGVDSSVVAALLHQAIGDQLLCIFVDTGLLRHQEGDEVMSIFAEHLGVRVERIDARARFMNALAGVADPEEKRKIIGREFIRVFEQAARSHSEARWLAQGTIYPDIIESLGTGGKAKVIKSHHNVGGLPEDMNLKLIEPLRQLFKNEVREMGLSLGLPASLIMRHPFPGPGLGVRILGEVRADYVHTLQLADHIFISELREAGLYDQVSQAFAVFLPVQSVGVVDGERRYAHVIALRAVQTIDFMTARAAPLDHDFLDRVATRIIQTCPEVSRVVYDISAKPPATIEWE